MPNVGIWEIALILLVLLLVFGPKRLPGIGRSLGRGMREFKESVVDTGRELKDATVDTPGQFKDALNPLKDDPFKEGEATPEGSAAVEAPAALPAPAEARPEEPAAAVSASAEATPEGDAKA